MLNASANLFDIGQGGPIGLTPGSLRLRATSTSMEASDQGGTANFEMAPDSEQAHNPGKALQPASDGLSNAGQAEGAARDVVRPSESSAGHTSCMRQTKQDSPHGLFANADAVLGFDGGRASRGAMHASVQLQPSLHEPDPPNLLAEVS